MNYISTRGQVEPIPFQQAVMMGLADDEGLLIPERIPDVSGRLAEWSGLGYRELAFAVVREFATDIPPADLRGLIDAAYDGQFPPEVAPLTRVGDVHLLELFHGPTLAFKDLALQWLGQLFEYILQRTGGRMTIVGATSGDTGSAAICGVRGRERIDIFVMHPHGRVSPIQERQMTTVLDANVHNIALEGSFDDCQRILKELFADLEFKRAYSLGAVNSVNWARVLAQIVYYFHAAFRLRERTGRQRVRFSVPTGNFGDILAGYYAARMGLPVSQLICASNENDILARFFSRGDYSLGEVVQTLSPSMDIQVASNFERYLYYLLGEDAGRLRQTMEDFRRTGAIRLPVQDGNGVDPLFAAGVGNRTDTLDTIRRYYREHGYVLDPHSAVGVCVAERIGLGGDPVVCLCTAHPAKFAAAVREATGEDVARHPAIDALMDLPTRCTVLPNDRTAVRDYVVGQVGKP